MSIKLMITIKKLLISILALVLCCGCTSMNKFRVSSTPVAKMSNQALHRDFWKTLNICTILRDDLRNLNEDQISTLVDAQVRLIEIKKEQSLRGAYP